MSQTSTSIRSDMTCHVWHPIIDVSITSPGSGSEVSQSSYKGPDPDFHSKHLEWKLKCNPGNSLSNLIWTSGLGVRLQIHWVSAHGMIQTPDLSSLEVFKTSGSGVSQSSYRGPDPDFYSKHMEWKLKCNPGNLIWNLIWTSSLCVWLQIHWVSAPGMDQTPDQSILEVFKRAWSDDLGLDIESNIRAKLEKNDLEGQVQ